MKNKFKTCEFRVYENGGLYSIIQVFYNHKKEIIGHSSFIYPVSPSQNDLKMQISNMLKASRKPPLTDKELNGKLKF